MKGSCLCAGVRYELTALLDQPVACHCSQNAKTSSNLATMASCRSADLCMIAEETLSSSRSSDMVERVFCKRCGGNLFWKKHSGDEIYVPAGTIDTPTHLRLEHIFVGSKSDFYYVTDGLL